MGNVIISQDAPSKKDLWIQPKGVVRFWNGNVWKVISNASANDMNNVNNVITGYYHNNSFYKDSSYENEIEGKLNVAYIDLEKEKIYRWNEIGYTELSIAKLEENVTSTVECGGILKGTTIQSGTTFTDFTNKLLNPNPQLTIYWSSVANANSGIPVNARQLGKTVLIKGSDTNQELTEYWWKNGTTDSDLIKKFGTASQKNWTNLYDPYGTDLVTGIAIAAALATLPEPMIFMGSIGTNGTINWSYLPEASYLNKGFTYKVITNHDTSPICKAGDTIISDGNSWVVIPSGDEPDGTVTNVAIQNNGGLTITGSPITTSGTIKIGHSNSITAGTAKGSDTSTLTFGGTFTIPSITFDSYGHIVSTTTTTMTMPSNPNKYRPIKVNGTQILANSSSTALDLIPGNNISLTNSSGAVTISSVNTWNACTIEQAGYVPIAIKGKFLHCNSSTGALEWVDDNNTTYTAGTGLTLSGTQFSITKANVSTIINLLDIGNSELTTNDYVITQCVGGGTTTTTYYRRPANKVINATLVKAALNTGSGTTKFLREDGTWQTPAYPTTLPANGGTAENVSGVVAIANGGTGATNAKSAEYNILSKASTALETDFNNTTRFAIEHINPSATNGVLVGYRTASQLWSYIKGKMSSDSAVNISGNAATATIFQNTRTINGTNFNGSANITTSTWGTSRNISISDADGTNTGDAVSVNGSENKTLKLPSTIKALLNGTVNGYSIGKSVPADAVFTDHYDWTDITNKPTIPAAQIQSDWSQTTTTALDYIKNKPTIPTVNNGTLTIKQNNTSKGTFTANQSGNSTIELTDTTYSDATTSASGLMSSTDKTKLNGIASGAEVNVQSDWNVTDNSSDAYIKNKPTIPAAQVNSDWNAVSGKAQILNKPTIPTKVSDLTNDSGFTNNVGTITGITMNGVSKGTSGVVDLGTVLTSHQNISGKADKSATVSNVSYDATNKKIQKTINGTTTDVVTSSNVVMDGGGYKVVPSAKWFVGTAITGTAASTSATISGSSAGDMYWNTSTNYVYLATTTNTWKYIGTYSNIIKTGTYTVDSSVNVSPNTSSNVKNNIGYDIKIQNTAVSVPDSGATLNTDFITNITGIKVEVEDRNSYQNIYTSSNCSIIAIHAKAIGGSSFAGKFEGRVSVSSSLTASSITATSVYQTSDDRLKDYKEDFSFDISKIINIPIKYFEYKNDENKTRHIGTSAQSLEKILPELVNANEEGFKSVDYSKLSLVAIDCIKQLQNKINELEKRIVELEKR